MKNVLERYNEKIDRTDGCWLWTGATKENGYGHFNGRRDGLNSNYVHRISWELHRGPIPVGQKVLHKCDVRNCVRPDHLFLGTQQDNHDDMISKGRAWFSNKTTCSKGHELDMVTKEGKRKCRKCVLEYQRNWYAKHGRKKVGG